MSTDIEVFDLEREFASESILDMGMTSHQSNILRKIISGIDCADIAKRGIKVNLGECNDAPTLVIDYNDKRITYRVPDEDSSSVVVSRVQWVGSDTIHEGLKISDGDIDWLTQS